MSKTKLVTDLIEEENGSASSPRRSSRIATRRPSSSCDEIIPSSPAKPRSRRPSLTLESNGTPALISRSKRSSLSVDSNSTKDSISSSLGKKTSSPTNITSDGPAKRTRRRGSLTQDEAEPSTPIPNQVSTRRLSGRRSMSISPTGNSPPTLENINLPKVTTPKRRGRRPSVTEKVIPLEAIEETDVNKGEDENNSSKIVTIDLSVDETESVDIRVSNAPKSENLETILESSIFDSREGVEIEKNLSQKLDGSCKSHISDTGIDKSFKKDKSAEILNINDTSLNKSSKDSASNVSSKRNKSVEVINEDLQENEDNSLNKSKSKNKTGERDSSNIEKAASDSLNVLSLSHNMSGASLLQETSVKLRSSCNKSSFCERVAYVDLSVSKHEFVNKSNESDKENQHKNPSLVINENSGINKESEDLFSEPMEIDDYPPDTSDENIAKCNTPNNSRVDQAKENTLNSSSIEKEEIATLSPIISSVGKRNKAHQLLNPNISVLYDVACANSTPKRMTLNQKENEPNDVDSNTPSKKLKDGINVSTEVENVKDKSKRNSRELLNSVDLNESKKIIRKSLSLNKSEQKSEENLNLSVNSNESKTNLNEKSNRKSKDLNVSDSNEQSTRILRSSTGSVSNASIDEDVEDFINLEKSGNKSASKEKFKRKSQSLLDEIDSDQSIEQTKRQSKNVSVVSDKSPFKDNSKRKSKNLSQSIDKDESIEKSNRKSKNLSQSSDQDKSIEKSVSEENTRKKFKDLLQSTDKEENVKIPLRKSICLSNLIDVDESGDDDDRTSQKSKSINGSVTETDVNSKSVNLSKNLNESISRKSLNVKLAASNKSLDKSKSDAELEATIDKFVANYSLMEDDEDDRHNSFVDSHASEGEEDTPSENSCDLPVDGESLGSSDSEKTLDESYEHDSFIVSDEEAELLSGNEFDLDQSRTSKRLKIVQDDDDSDDMKTNSKTEQKKQESENIVPSINILEPSPEKKKTSQKTVEEDSDLENMSTKPYCGLDSPSVASSRESLSEADKIEVSNKPTENLIDQSKISPIKSPRNSLNTSFTGNLNISVVEDEENTTRRSRTTSLLVQEQFENYNVENVCDHISKVVNMVYSDAKKDVDVSLNVSLEFTQKRKSKTTNTPNTTVDLKLPIENMSSDVISVPSSEDDTSKSGSKESISVDYSTDSDMSDDVDEDVTTKYYESRLISKEEDMSRQSNSRIVKQRKPEPKFSSSSEEGEEEEQQNESLLKQPDIKNLKKHDQNSSKPNKNITGVMELVKKRKLDKIKILQSTKLIPNTSQATKPPILRESAEVVPSKKIKLTKESTIKKKKHKLQPSKNLVEGDNLKINYFPSKILNTVVRNEKSNSKPRIVPSNSANQTSWNCKKAASPLKPSSSIFTQKKSKLERNMKERDFKTKMLNDKSRNKRMDMEALLMMKEKLKQRSRP